MTPSTGPGNRQAPANGARIMLRQYIHWRRLIGATVQIRQHGQLIRTGTIDDAMADSTALWIAGDAAQPRTMYGAAHGIEVWAHPEEASHHLERTAIELHIRIIHSTVTRPQGRGKIERFFGTINTELLPPPSPGIWDRGTGNHSPRSTSLDWIAPLEASSPPTMIGPTARSVSHHGMLGLPTAGFPGCPKAWRTSTDSS